MDSLQVTSVGQGVRLGVRVHPRASRQALAGVQEGNLKIYLNAPPAEGAANRGLIKFLAEVLQIAPSCLSIISGRRSRSKLVEIKGLDAREVLHRLQL
jgi:uncharacterized protein (TIGR00251 family)